MRALGVILISTISWAASADDAERALKNIAFVMSGGMPLQHADIDVRSNNLIVYRAFGRSIEIKRTADCTYRVPYSEGQEYQVDFRRVSARYVYSCQSMGICRFQFPAWSGGSCNVGPMVNRNIPCLPGLRTVITRMEEADALSQSIFQIQEALCPVEPPPAVGPRF